jgi:hypothetical protein
MRRAARRAALALALVLLVGLAAGWRMRVWSTDPPSVCIGWYDDARPSWWCFPDLRP